MTIPAAIKTQIADLQATFIAASPVEQAPPLVFANLATKAASTVFALDAAVASTGGTIDAYVQGTWAPTEAVKLTALSQSVQDELDCYEARSLIGRFASNIDLIGGQV